MKRFAFTLSLLAAGIVCAQSPQAAPGGGPGHRGGPRGNPDDMFEARLTKHLSLNATQQNAVHTVLAERRVTTSALGPQMRTLHTQMMTAIKNGDEAGIEKASTELSALHQQQEVAQAKAASKIYSSLTADQKTKVGDHLEMLMEGGPGFGPGPRGGFGRHGGPPPAAAPAVKQ
jgi:Spy/CpxP family protein refolding chaperone